MHEQKIIWSKTCLDSHCITHEQTIILLSASGKEEKKAPSDNYRLTHSASELSAFTCTRSITMNNSEYLTIIHQSGGE